MKKITALLILFALSASTVFAVSDVPEKPMISPGTIAATSATLIWDKPGNYANIVRYHIIVDGKEIGTSERSNYIINSLTPAKAYNCLVKAEGKDGKLSAGSAVVKFTTIAKGKVLDVTTFGAKGDGTTLNTKAIQKAIDDCPVNGTVQIPQGTFVTGALYLKSHMTLQIDKGGVLKGSLNVDDYLPYYNNRFEGWELKTYASLLNAGKMDNKGGYTTQDISIKGEGTISGGNTPLGKAMIAKDGLRCRGRLICLMNCQNVEIQGLNVQDSPCWTIHYIYSKNISLHDLNIVSTAFNGDGIDPDSSDDSYIFNCTFSTGDDCIAIKSGKNPEGFTIGKPTKNVRITDCNFVKGHGISIGSEISGGVSDVLVQDCKAGALIYGMQIKATKERGGYVKNVTVADCQLQQITVFSKLNYNNDGQAAPEPPTFENYVFKNIDLTGANGTKPVIDINGFNDPTHKLKNVLFENIRLPDNAKVVINDAEGVKFTGIKSVGAVKPEFSINNSKNVVN